jgi:hypothetical protein
MIGFAFDLVRLVVGLILFGALLVVAVCAAALMLVVWPVFLLALFL